MAEVASSQATSGSQMSTQSLREVQEMNSQVLDSSVAEDAVWGRLLAMRSNVQVYNLSESSYTFGRGNVDHQLTEKTFDGRLLAVISKVHFRITREICKGNGDAIIYIEDLSSNGTFINKKLVGKKKKQILNNNDEIGLAQANCKVFMFYDCQHNDADQYPAELSAKYTVGRRIGEGTFGEVRLAYKQDTLERCAVKILKKKLMSSNGNTLIMSNLTQIQNEVQLLQSIDHPCIIRLWDVFESEERIFIVMELAEGGELFDRITRSGHLSEAMARLYCYQLALAIHHLHSQGITHRDIKPENVLLGSDAELSCVKLTDFGLSKLTVDASQMSTFCGTKLYIAPELLIPGATTSYTNKVDMWSFGVVLFACLAGYLPFRDNNELKLRYLISTAHFKFEGDVWRGVSEEAKALVRELLVADPAKRSSTEQVLKHAWFQDPEMQRQAEQLMNGVADAPTLRPSENGTGHFNRPNNRRVLNSPEAQRRIRDAKTPRLCVNELI